MKVSFTFNRCKEGIDLGKVHTAYEILISTDTRQEDTRKIKQPGLITARYLKTLCILNKNYLFLLSFFETRGRSSS